MSNYKLPVRFEELETIYDNRFIRVKIWIAHTGENRNACDFSKEVLESMIPSLANVPILGFIESKNGEEDFVEHNEKLHVDEKGKISLKYHGHAYGVIPEVNNARFENRYGEDGIEREYLVCEGILWRKFDQVEQIFERDGGYKGQSMELEPNSCEGYMNDKGIYVFTKAKFEGACILGEGVRPAMVSSSIERFSTNQVMKDEFGDMLNELNRFFSENKPKGDESVEDKDKDLNKPVENEPTEPVSEGNEGEEPETTTEPEGENADGEGTADNKDGEGETGEGEEPATSTGEEGEQASTEGDQAPTEFSRTFTLSHEDIRSKLYGALDKDSDFSDEWYYIDSVFDDHAVVNLEGSNKYFKVFYVKHEEAVEIGEKEEIFPMWVNAGEKLALDTARNNFASVEAENKELRQFKAQVQTLEKEQKLHEYSSVLSPEDIATLKENITKFTVQDMEKEIGYMLLKNNQFSVKEKEVSTKVKAVNNTQNNEYGSLASFFYKS